MTETHELLLTLDRRTRATQDAVNYIAWRLDNDLHDRRGHMRLIASIVIDNNGVPHTMSASTTITLTNAADPSKSTRYLGVLDIANGTTVPTITVSDATKLTAVPDPAGVVNGTFTFGLYPIDALAETDDSVTATVSLAGNPDIVLTFDISGQPVPAPETDTLDAKSAVGTWAGAPAVPATPA